ncbi:unnamed protein product [Amoebophrya sp. A25]|nr:unnamed protein product [Amoebophrya sp. A25]|eukprot:GSA25T00011776001.1
MVASDDEDHVVHLTSSVQSKQDSQASTAFPSSQSSTAFNANDYYYSPDYKVGPNGEVVPPPHSDGRSERSTGRRGEAGLSTGRSARPLVRDGESASDADNVDDPGGSGKRSKLGKDYLWYDPIAQAKRLHSWMSVLIDAYGWKLIAMLVLTQHIVKGFVFSYLATSLDFVLKFYQVPGPRIQIYKAVVMAPWGLKPLFGVISDKFPLFGYHKNSYMAIVTVLAVAATGYVGVQGLYHYSINEPQSKSTLKDALPLNAFIVCQFLAYMQISVCDLLSEARYAGAMRESPEHGPDLMTFVWAGISVGAFIGTLTIGYVLESFGPFFPSLIASGVSSFVLYGIFQNWLQERNVNSTEDQEEHLRAVDSPTEQEPKSLEEGRGGGPAHTEQQGKQEGRGPAPTGGDGENRTRRRGPRVDSVQRVPPELVGLAFFMGGCAIFMVAAGMQQRVSVAWNCLFAAVLSVAVLIVFQAFTSPAIANMNFFFFVQTAMTMSIEGASFYFFTDTVEEYPDGPHFSIWFYTTGIGMIAAIFNLVGMAMYQQYFKHWRYHRLFLIANLVQCGFSLLGILVYTRFSKQVLGIPDQVFILGGSVILSIVHQWMWIPGVVLLAQLCPRGVEATMYALLAGCHNIGNGVGQVVGAFVLQSLGVQPDGTKKDATQFSNLWIASVLGTVLPMLTLLIMPWMIPNATQTEVLLEEDADGVEGSWYRNWIGSRYGGGLSKAGTTTGLSGKSPAASSIADGEETGLVQRRHAEQAEELVSE